MTKGKFRSDAVDSARSRAWSAMRNFEQRRDAFTLAQVQTVIQDEPGGPVRRSENLAKYFRHLERGGYLRRVSDGRERAWRLANDAGPLAPVAGRDGAVFDPNPVAHPPPSTVRAQIWRTIRELGGRGAVFTVDEVHEMVRARADMQDKGRAGALSYITRLARAGYLERVLEAREFVWRLARDTGPQAPVLRQGGGVFDPNTGETHAEGRILSFEGVDAGRMRA